MTDKLDPEEVLRCADQWAKTVGGCVETALVNAATLIRQMQAAMVEAERRAACGMTVFGLKCIVEPLAPFLPKPVDPVVAAVDEANDAGGETVAQWTVDFTEALARRGGTITWKDGV